MACFHLTDRHNIATLELRKLPAFSPERMSSLQVVVQHLKGVLEQFGDGHPPAVKIPSVVALATFYHCDILDLLESLSLLREYRYDYLMKGLDLPIILVDPLSRMRVSRSVLRQKARRVKASQAGKPSVDRPLFPNYPM